MLFKVWNRERDQRKFVSADSLQQLKQKGMFFAHFRSCLIQDFINIKTEINGL